MVLHFVDDSRFSIFYINFPKKILVLIGYLVSDFHSVEKPKGGPLEIEKFFVEGGLRKGLEGVRSPPKPSSTFFSTETKILKSETR